MSLLIGAGGGGGFNLGPSDNIFGVDSGTDLTVVTLAPDLATAEATRDTYDSNNAGWKDSYLDKDLNIILYYQVGGSDYIQYQRNQGGTWTNNNSAVIAIRGPAGATGNSYFFPSIAARDSFFGYSGNWGLLENGVPVSVNRSNGVTQHFYWAGATAPPNYDANLFHPALSADGAYEIYDASDLEKIQGYSGGVITTTAGQNLTLRLINSLIITPVKFVTQRPSEVRITSPLASAILVFTEADTYFSGEAVRFSLDNVVLVSNSVNPSTFADTKGCTINLHDSAISGFNDLGTYEGVGLTEFGTSGRCYFSEFSSGIKFKNMIHSLSSLVFTSSTLVGDLFNITNNIPSQVVSTFSEIKTQLGASNNIFNVSPVSVDNFKMVTESILTTGGEGLFNTSGGTTGTFTAVADVPFSLGIASVAPSTGGLAQFTLSSGDVFVGQIVTISNYVTNTAYNDTFVVLDVPVAGDFVVDVDFGSNEAGGQLDSDVIQLTDIGTAVSDGDALTISTNNTLMYDGGAIAFDKQTDSFKINREYSGAASGTWDTSPVDQKAPNITAVTNPPFANSTVKAEIKTEANALLTTIPAAGAKVLINASSWTVETLERMKGDSKGGVIYSGLEPTSILCDDNTYLEPSNATKTLSCQFARQDATRVSCTFDDVNNYVVTGSAHNLSVDDLVTFNDTDGTLDTALRDDVIYYVESTPSATEFTLKYTVAGAAINLDGGSSGLTSFAVAELAGARHRAPIAQNNARTLVPQALIDVENGDKIYRVISNEDDTVSVKVIDSYFRAVK